MKPLVSVIITAYNRCAMVEEAIESVLKQDFLDYEIIVVDDGSSDKTAEEAKLGQGKVIQHPHNVGYGRSLKNGIDVAKYDTIVIIDADGTYPAEEMPALLSEFRKGFNMVIGARQGKYLDESLKKKNVANYPKKIG